jgi:fluoroacetyl-CoA thioesterase
MKEFRIGAAAEATEMVLHTNTAKAMGSGSLDVYATPALIALMEKAACTLVDPCLDEETTSVGISMNMSHDAATAVGKTVTAKAVLVGVDGRKLTFKLTASDEHGIIGQGTHERFLVKKEKFMSKLAAKYNN